MDTQISSDLRAVYGGRMTNAMLDRPLMERLAQTNADPNLPLGMPSNAMIVPSDRFPNVAGLTDRAGNVFLMPNDDLSMPNTAAHEGFHSRMRGAGLRPDDLTKYDMPFSGISRTLRENMARIQRPGETAMHFGANYGDDREELVASLMGYEGSLPKGVPITESPYADILFDQSNYKHLPVMPQNALKSFYFDTSSLPYKSAYEGQAPGKGWRDSLADLAKSIALRLGLNTVNR